MKNLLHFAAEPAAKRARLAPVQMTTFPFPDLLPEMRLETVNHMTPLSRAFLPLTCKHYLSAYHRERVSNTAILLFAAMDEDYDFFCRLECTYGRYVDNPLQLIRYALAGGNNDFVERCLKERLEFKHFFQGNIIAFYELIKLIGECGDVAAFSIVWPFVTAIETSMSPIYELIKSAKAPFLRTIHSHLLTQCYLESINDYLEDVDEVLIDVATKEDRETLEVLFNLYGLKASDHPSEFVYLGRGSNPADPAYVRYLEQHRLPVYEINNAMIRALETNNEAILPDLKAKDKDTIIPLEVALGYFTEATQEKVFDKAIELGIIQIRDTEQAFSDDTDDVAIEYVIKKNIYSKASFAQKIEDEMTGCFDFCLHLRDKLAIPISDQGLLRAAIREDISNVAKADGLFVRLKPTKELKEAIIGDMCTADSIYSITNLVDAKFLCFDDFVDFLAKQEWNGGLGLRQLYSLVGYLLFKAPENGFDPVAALFDLTEVLKPAVYHTINPTGITYGLYLLCQTYERLLLAKKDWKKGQISALVALAKSKKHRSELIKLLFGARPFVKGARASFPFTDLLPEMQGEAVQQMSPLSLALFSFTCKDFRARFGHHAPNTVSLLRLAAADGDYQLFVNIENEFGAFVDNPIDFLTVAIKHKQIDFIKSFLSGREEVKDFLSFEDEIHSLMVALGLHGDVQCYSTITSMLCPHEISERSLFVLLQHANVNLLQSIPQERDLFDECKDLSSYIILDLLKSLLKEGRTESFTILCSLYGFAEEWNKTGVHLIFPYMDVDVFINMDYIAFLEAHNAQLQYDEDVLELALKSNDDELFDYLRANHHMEPISFVNAFSVFKNKQQSTLFDKARQLGLIRPLISLPCLNSKTGVEAFAYLIEKDLLPKERLGYICSQTNLDPSVLEYLATTHKIEVDACTFLHAVLYHDKPKYFPATIPTEVTALYITKMIIDCPIYHCIPALVDHGLLDFQYFIKHFNMHFVTPDDIGRGLRQLWRAIRYSVAKYPTNGFCPSTTLLAIIKDLSINEYNIYANYLLKNIYHTLLRAKKWTKDEANMILQTDLHGTPAILHYLLCIALDKSDS